MKAAILWVCWLLQLIIGLSQVLNEDLVFIMSSSEKLCSGLLLSVSLSTSTTKLKRLFIHICVYFMHCLEIPIDWVLIKTYTSNKQNSRDWSIEHNNISFNGVNKVLAINQYLYHLYHKRYRTDFSWSCHLMPDHISHSDGKGDSWSADCDD